MEERLQVEVPGGTIGVRRLGAGPPLVLINGYAGSNLDWDPTFLAALGRFATLICPDNRGIGASPAGDGLERLSIESMAADALATLDGLAIDSAPLVGWSMGGFIAQAVALAAPARVEALVLLGTDPGAGAELGDREAWERLLDYGGSPREQASRLIALLFPAAVAERIDAEFGDLLAKAREQLDHEVLDAQERAMGAWHQRRDTTALEALPTLAAAGSLDAVIPPANAELIAARARDSWLARFPGCGHAFMAQEPERVAALIAAFLGR